MSTVEVERHGHDQKVKDPGLFYWTKVVEKDFHGHTLNFSPVDEFVLENSKVCHISTYGLRLKKFVAFSTDYPQLGILKDIDIVFLHLSQGDILRIKVI
jgi:hypothetical protein